MIQERYGVPLQAIFERGTVARVAQLAALEVVHRGSGLEDVLDLGAAEVGRGDEVLGHRASPPLMRTTSRPSTSTPYLSRKAATEFSFFLAIPIMFAATFYDVYKHRDILHFDDVGVFVVGFVASFISALARSFCSP